MHRYFFFVVLSFPTICFGQSLPACQPTGLKHNCTGGFSTPTGLKYEGEWRDGKRHGQGTETLPNGSTYQGSFRDGRYDGEGVFTYPDGTRFVGEYRDNKQNGKGIYYDNKGSVIALGTWKDNRHVSSDPVDFNRFPFTTRIRGGIERETQLSESANPSASNSNQASSQVLSSDSNIALKIESERKAHKELEAKLKAQAEEERKKREQLEIALAEATNNRAKPPESLSKTRLNKEDISPVFAARKALIIGNDAYFGDLRLKNAVADAKAMAVALQASGYKVDLRLDLGEKQFKEALRLFRYEIKGGDEVFFFFAGHGVEIGGINFLLPTDIKISGVSEDRDRDQLIDDGVDLKRFMSDLEIQKPKFTLAVIDACREDPFPRKAGTRNVSTKVGLAQTTPATGQMIIFSAGSGQKALDSLGPKDRSANGVFTRVFVEKIKEPGIPVDRILKNVRSEVSRLAKSVNHTQVPAIYDEAEGDFYFRLKEN